MLGLLTGCSNTELEVIKVTISSCDVGSTATISTTIGMFSTSMTATCTWEVTDER